MAGFLLFGTAASFLLAIGVAMIKVAALPAARGARKASVQSRAGWLIRCGGRLLLQCAGYLAYLFALSGAPVSLLAVTMEAGTALFVVVAIVFICERAQPQEWVGIIGTAGAILFSASRCPAARLQARPILGGSFCSRYWRAPRQC